MFTPCCNYFGGYHCNFFNNCCYGYTPFTYTYSPFMYNNPFFSNPFPFLKTDLCCVNYANSGSLNTPSFKMPEFSSFLPKADSLKVTVPTYTPPAWSSFTNVISNLCKDSLKYYQSPFMNNYRYSSNYPTLPEQTLKQKQEISYDAKKLEEKWKNSSYAKQSKCKLKTLPPEFFQKVVDISKKINCNPDDLMAVMNFESAKTFSASVKNSNPKSTATGLIQFTETTASGKKKKDGTREGGLGTTCAELARMTETEQLEYVEKYLVEKAKKFNGEYLDLSTLYALVFAPGKAKQEVFYTQNTEEYIQNSCLDTNHDGVITKTEAAGCVMQCLA